MANTSKSGQPANPTTSVADKATPVTTENTVVTESSVAGQFATADEAERLVGGSLANRSAGDANQNIPEDTDPAAGGYSTRTESDADPLGYGDDNGSTDRSTARTSAQTRSNGGDSVSE